MYHKHIILTLHLLLLTACGPHHQFDALPPQVDITTDSYNDSCSFVKIEAERLPDLNVPRNAHAAFCINSQRGCSFSQFVTDYRINHAKELMHRQPEMKISDICVNSGFFTESSFFRAFKNATGMTLDEWNAPK